MVIPIASNYPTSFDSQADLYEVHDALRLTLANDYNPGDTTIYWSGDTTVAATFPATGIITLTEQCSDIDKRAISFYYSNINLATSTFTGLEILPEFNDVPKPALITDITMNVMAIHHNTLKEAIIAIENFVGVKGTLDIQPYGATMEGRINFLRKLVLVPRAWFATNIRIGLVPLEVEFQDLSFYLATDGQTGPITYLWDFGDNTASSISLISTISVIDVVPTNATNVLVDDLNGGSLLKTYMSPGIYDVTLTVSNNFGSNTVTFPQLIHARVAAPGEATIEVTPGASQFIEVAGVPTGGPYTITPVIRSPVNTLIAIEVPQGQNPNITDEKVSFAGELLNSQGYAIDPVIEYSWEIGDDLPHGNSFETTVSFGDGGVYDCVLRVDTEFGAYRITVYRGTFDIVEQVNLWLWLFTDSTNTFARTNEFGLVSQTFKTSSMGTIHVNANDSFLDSVPSAAQQQQEFNRNTLFSPRGNITSGSDGSAFIFWASGRNVSDPPTAENINVMEFQGFNTGEPAEYTSHPAITGQPWNWAGLAFSGLSYFLFGTNPSSSPTPNASPVFNNFTTYAMLNEVITTGSFASTDFKNGAQELLNNVATFDNSGNSVYGNFSVYRTATQGDAGYILRNDGVGPFFRLQSFYGTSGTLGTPVTAITKLTNIQGPTVVEGQLTDLTQGIYFFNNSGSVPVYNPTTSVWTVSGPGINSVAYRSLQDITASGFDNPANTLLVTSDGANRAYITFDYSPNVFLLFNSINQTFTTLNGRPLGNQWLCGIY